MIRLPNEGHIWDTPPTKFVNVGEDKPKILLDEKMFDDNVDIDLPIFLNNLVLFFLDPTQLSNIPHYLEQLYHNLDN